MMIAFERPDDWAAEPRTMPPKSTSLGDIERKGALLMVVPERLMGSSVLNPGTALVVRSERTLEMFR